MQIGLLLRAVFAAIFSRAAAGRRTGFLSSTLHKIHRSPPSPSPCISTACRRRSGALWRRRCPAKRGASRHRCSANDAAAIVLTAPKAFDWLAAYPSLQIRKSNARQLLAETRRGSQNGRASGGAKDENQIRGQIPCAAPE